MEIYELDLFFTDSKVEPMASQEWYLSEKSLFGLNQVLFSLLCCKEVAEVMLSPIAQL
jgi:hypothetical protein